MAAIGAIFSGIALLLQGLDEMSRNAQAAHPPQAKQHAGLWTAATDKAIAPVYLHHEKAADAALAAAAEALSDRDVSSLIAAASTAKAHIEAMDQLRSVVRKSTADSMRPRISRRLKRLVSVASEAHEMRLEPEAPTPVAPLRRGNVLDVG